MWSSKINQGCLCFSVYQGRWPDEFFFIRILRVLSRVCGEEGVGVFLCENWYLYMASFVIFIRWTALIYLQLKSWNPSWYWSQLPLMNAASFVPSVQMLGRGSSCATFRTTVLRLKTCVNARNALLRLSVLLAETFVGIVMWIPVRTSKTFVHQGSWNKWLG